MEEAASSQSQDLRLEIKRLTEELAQCEADKEFIWLLWKQFQKESPDLAAAVDMVVTRERMKQEESNKKMSLSLLAKDKELSTLQSLIDNKEKELSDLRKRLSDAESQYCQLQNEYEIQVHLAKQQAQQMSKILSKNEEICQQKANLDQLIKEGCTRIKRLEQDLTHRDKLNEELELQTQHLNSIQDKAVEYQKQVKALETECKVVTEKCHCLSQQLQLKEESLKKERGRNQQKDSQIKKLREQLKVKSDSNDGCSKQFAIQSSLAHQLHIENSQLKAELAMSEEKLCLMIQEKEQSNTAEKALCQARLQLPGDLDNNDMSTEAAVEIPTSAQAEGMTNEVAEYDSTKLTMILETTEKELFECRMQLKTKSEELVGLRSAHDRRLERMQTLELDYNLLLEQLQTYETKSKKKTTNDTVHRKVVCKNLRHENSEKVWNELSHYKSICEDLKKQTLCLEEERDVFRSKYLRNQTTIAELRAALHHQKSDLERKLSAIATVESFNLEESLSQNEMKRLQLRVEELVMENKHALKEKRELEWELKMHREEVTELQSTINEIKKMRREEEVRRMSRLGKFTRTEVDIAPLARVTTAVQVSLPLIKLEMKDAQVSTNSIRNFSPSNVAIPEVQRTHKRTRSDGEVLFRRSLTLDSNDNSTTACCSSGKASEKLQRHTSEKQRTTHKSSLQSREHRCSYHQCLWLNKAKSLQHRLKTVLEQVSILTKTKLSMSQCLEESKSASEKSKKDVRDLMLRLEGQKSTLSSLQKEKEKLQNTVQKQQEKITELKREATLFGKRTDLEWKKLEANQKDLRENYSALKMNVKSLEESLHQRSTQVSHLQESNSRAERDLKQKRQLIEDLKNKLKQEKENSFEVQEKIKALSTETATLSETVERQKHKVDHLRSQLSHQTTYKDRLMEMLQKCQTELEHSVQQLTISQDLQKQQKKHTTQVELSFKISLEELEKRFKDKLHQAESSLAEAEGIVQEFNIFIMDLAKELFHHISIKHIHESEQFSTAEHHIMSARVREIARDALKMSEVDLNDFLGEKPTDKPCEHERLWQFMNLIETTVKSKPPFASKLLKNFVDFLYS